MKCPCPTYCKYCGRSRSRDVVGHYCRTKNCQWQHGYDCCTLHLTEAERRANDAAVKKAR